MRRPTQSHVITFKPRFAELIEKGKKCQTIRPPRKRKISVGDVLSLRTWTGRPYRSKQRIIGNGICTAVREIFIKSFPVFNHREFLFLLDGRVLNFQGANELARFDGFNSGEEMLFWFLKEHGFPFTGQIICWKPIKKARR